MATLKKQQNASLWHKKLKENNMLTTIRNIALRVYYNRTVQRLRSMTDAQLRDIGICRADICCAVTGKTVH